MKSSSKSTDPAVVNGSMLQLVWVLSAQGLAGVEGKVSGLSPGSIQMTVLQSMKGRGCGQGSIRVLRKRYLRRLGRLWKEEVHTKQDFASGSQSFKWHPVRWVLIIVSLLFIVFRLFSRLIVVVKPCVVYSVSMESNNKSSGRCLLSRPKSMSLRWNLRP